MLISEAKWHVRAFQSLPWFPNAQKKTKELSVRNNSHRKATVHFQSLCWSAVDDAPKQRSPPKAGFYASILIFQYLSALCAKHTWDKLSHAALSKHVTRLWMGVVVGQGAYTGIVNETVTIVIASIFWGHWSRPMHWVNDLSSFSMLPLIHSLVTCKTICINSCNSWNTYYTYCIQLRLSWII